MLFSFGLSCYCEGESEIITLSKYHILYWGLELPYFMDFGHSLKDCVSVPEL